VIRVERAVGSDRLAPLRHDDELRAGAVRLPLPGGRHIVEGDPLDLERERPRGDVPDQPVVLVGELVLGDEEVRMPEDREVLEADRSGRELR
jgi:hypothetical protein